MINICCSSKRKRSHGKSVADQDNQTYWHLNTDTSDKYIFLHYPSFIYTYHICICCLWISYNAILSYVIVSICLRTKTFGPDRLRNMFNMSCGQIKYLNMLVILAGNTSLPYVDGNDPCGPNIIKQGTCHKQYLYFFLVISLWMSVICFLIN